MTQKHTKRYAVLLLLAGLLLAGLIFGVIYYPKLSQEYTAPLGPGLELPTQTATQAGLPTATLASTQATLAPGITPTATQAPLCGGPALMYVLGIGADSGSSYKYGLADAIRIARIDFAIPKITTLTMPRDLWVEIPDVNTKYNIDHGKLNQAYFYGGAGMGYYNGPGEGPGLLARTLDLNFGIRADYYGAVNMNTFVKIVDAVGGIDVNLAKPVDGRSENPSVIDLGFFTAGKHHLDGESALRLSRIRHKYNDFTRQDNQTLVLCALKAKLKDPAIIAKIPKLIEAFQGAVQTDLSPQQLVQLACLAPQIKRENVIFASLPAEIMQPGRAYDPRRKNTTYVEEVDFNVIRDYVSRFMAGTWPDQPSEPSCP